MKLPVTVTIDYEPTYPATYIYYVPEERVNNPLSRRIGDTVVVDVDRVTGELAGIELLDLEPATIITARKIASDHGAEFPAHLTAVPA